MVPRFSLVMTTTDRPSLLPAGVRAALAQDFDDFELIVSDNFSKIPATEILKSVWDRRVRIIRTDRRLSVSDHWEFAWEHIRGEYVMYLGDDNALHPSILSFADRAISDYDLDLVSWRVCTYFHPDWNIAYGALPSRGNIMFIDVGTTQKLYVCNGREVLAHFCQHLRTYGCFACMLNCLFRKSIVDEARAKAGRIFLGGVPETSSSFIVIGMARPDGYAFFDGFGAIAGRSRDSAFASMLSGGKASRRHHEYVEEFRGGDLLPLHEPKFLAISNMLAGTISQVRSLLPEYFAQYDFDRAVLARKTIDDLYVDRTVPWVDNPNLLAQVDQFINSLPAPVAADISAYRDECRARWEEAGNVAPAPPNAQNAPESLLDSLRKVDRKFAWQLFRDTGRNPLGRYWISGGTTCIDMSLYGGRDIADAVWNFGRVLKHFDRYDEGFAHYYRQLGMLRESLAIEPPHKRAGVPVERITKAQYAG
jgi:glycosyltransferase involved in cell wall biosynthesis